MDFVNRLLSDRIIGADLIDRVAKKIDPVRIGGGERKDVDDAAAHGKLSFVGSHRVSAVAERGQFGGGERRKGTSSPTFQTRHSAAEEFFGDGLLEHGLQGGGHNVRAFCFGERVQDLKPFADDVGARRDLFGGEGFPRRKI